MIKEYSSTTKITFKQFQKSMGFEEERSFEDSGSFGKSFNDLLKQISLSTSGSLKLYKDLLNK